MNSTKRKNRHGFTLGETLIVVAIIGVLAALTTGAVITIHRTIRQKQLDDLAGQIYQVAERQLTAMKNAGELDAAAAQLPADADGAHVLAYVPGDASETAQQSGTATVKQMLTNGLNASYAGTDAIHLLYITPADTAMADLLLPQDALMSDVRGANWIIEYDAASGNVYGVFYSELVALNTDDADTAVVSGYTLNQLRAGSKVRRAAGAKIGYYGGSAVWQAAPKTLNADLFLSNAEQLKAVSTFKLPQVSLNGTAQTDTLTQVGFTVTDEHNGTWSFTAAAAPSGSGYKFTNIKDAAGKVIAPKLTLTSDSVTKISTLSLVLDSMASGGGFAAQTGLTLGDDIAVTVKLTTKTGIMTSATARGNSAFASKEAVDATHTTVNIAYGRHLQNLGRYDTAKIVSYLQAVQTRDIHFENTLQSTEDWYDLYSAAGTPLTFVPLAGSQSQHIESYNGNDHIISGLTIRDGGANVGMFAQFYGSSLQHVRMTDTAITALNNAASVGALAGMAAPANTASGKTLTVSDCAVYLSDSGITAAKKTNTSPYKNMFSGGSAIGGLAGTVSGYTSVAVSESSASTTMAGANSAGTVGGLFGVLSGAPSGTTITRSYADNYLTGGSVGGLVGQNSGKLTVQYCYAVGFQFVGTGNGSSAGLVLHKTGTLKISNCYAAVSQSGSTTYSVTNAAKGTSSATYFLDKLAGTQDNTNSNGGATAAVYAYMCGTSYRTDGSENGSVQNSLLQILNGKTSAFRFADKTSTADYTFYNLNDNALADAYPYPVLTHEKQALASDGTTVLYAAAAGIHQYGDWQATFLTGLVYYEKYSDGTYGFYGSNVSLLRNDKTVVRDGYALAYTSDFAIKTNETVKVTLNGGKIEEKNVVSSNPPTVSDGTTTYSLCILDDLYADQLDSVKPAVTGFYQELKVAVGTGVGTVDNSANRAWFTFYFNPFFAKTGSTVKPTQAPSPVAIRTARQLYSLARYSDYWNLSYAQEIAVDYTSYTEGAVYTSGTANLIGTQNINTSRTAAVQNPIGTATTPFTGSYDGGTYPISGVSFAAEAPAQQTTGIGLFGFTSGRLANIVLNGNDAANTASHRYFGYTGASLNTGSARAYLGALAGYNSGVITNCAVAGYVPMSSSGTADTLSTYNNSTLYLGGLIGENVGAVQGCSADTPLMQVASTKAYARVGGLTGANTGSIRQCYAFARLYGTLSDNDDAQYGGFAGVNSGNIEYSYCASSVVVAGLATKYGFSSGSAVTDCYYVSGSNGDYYGNIYAYTFEAGISGTSAGASAVTMGQLSAANFDLLSHGFAKVGADQTKLNTLSTGAFAYPAIASLQGVVGSIGNWPTKVDLGTVGVVYWEHEEGGSNPGWYFSYVDSDNKTRDTLCKVHDDGGAVTSYGYGYFCTKGTEGAWNRYSTYIDLSDGTAFNSAAGSISDAGMAVQNTTAAAQLESMMPQYSFVVYTTGITSNDLRLTGNNKSTTTYEKSATAADGLSWVETYSSTAKNEEKNADLTTAWAGGTLADYDSSYTQWGGYQNVNDPWYRCTYAQAAGSTSAALIRTGETSLSAATAAGSSTTYSDGSIYYEDGTVLKPAAQGAQDLAITSKPTETKEYFVVQYSRNKKKWYNDSFTTYKAKLRTEGQSSDIVTVTASDGTVYNVYDVYNIPLTSPMDGYYYRALPSDSGDSSFFITTTTPGVTKYYTCWHYARQGEYGYYAGYAETGDTSTHYLPNGSLTLTSRTDASGSIGYSFVLNPFFGNSMAYVPVEDLNLPANAQTRQAAIESVIGTGEASDTNANALGKSGAPYSVRSIQQLQFINWNNKVMNCTTAATGDGGTPYTAASAPGTYKENFTYLTALTEEKNIDNSTAHAASDANAPKVASPNFYWAQMHDLEAKNVAAYTPIADCASARSSYNLNLWIAFSGSYNGRDYAIRNLSIHSSNFSVGVFGVTVNAVLKNIVLYSDSSSVIQRTGTKNGAYAIGGLVAVAYAIKGAGEESNVISNCAISGYTIDDESQGQQYVGETSVGGLIGVANTNIRNCTSYVNITMNPVYKSYASSGNYDRVGGLAGSSKYNVTNCYSGGTITVSDAARNNQTLYTDNNKVCIKHEKSNNIYVGGLVGGAFSSTYKNLGATMDSTNTTYKNCYTYMELPEFGKAVRAVCAIATVADRYAYGIALTIENSYYLESEVLKNNVKPEDLTSDDIVGNAAEARLDSYEQRYYNWNGNAANHGYTNETALLKAVDANGFKGSDGTTIVGTNTFYENMILGCMNYQRYQIVPTLRGNNKSGQLATETIDLTALTYSELADAGMSARLGTAAGWAAVSTQENGAVVNGKYTFNSDEKYEGQNYPFPTILQQNGYHVHYGDWPAMGIYAVVKGKLVVAVNGALDMVAPENPNAAQEPTLTIVILRQGSATDGTLTCALNEEGATGVTVADCQTAQGAVDGYSDSVGSVTFTGKNVGNASFKITFTDAATGQAYETYFDISVSANITLTAPASLTLASGVTTTLTGEDALLKAVSSTGAAITQDYAWSVVSSDTDVLNASVTPHTATDGTADGMGMLKITTGDFEQSTQSLLVTYTVTKGSGANQRQYTQSRVVDVTIVPPDATLSNENGVLTDGTKLSDMIPFDRSAAAGYSFTTVLPAGLHFSDYALSSGTGGMGFAKDANGSYQTLTVDAVPVYALEDTLKTTPVDYVKVQIVPQVVTASDGTQTEQATVTILPSASSFSSDSFSGFFALNMWNAAGTDAGGASVAEGTRSLLLHYVLSLTGNTALNAPALVAGMASAVQPTPTPVPTSEGAQAAAGTPAPTSAPAAAQENASATPTPTAAPEPTPTAAPEPTATPLPADTSGKSS